MNLLENIEVLSQLGGISGDEDIVREKIMEQIKDNCEYKTDSLGNLIVFKKGKSLPKNRVMVAAHMDEVGFIVKYIDEKGNIKFSTVGGIDTRVIVGKQVKIMPNGIQGVIGVKPVHLLTTEEKGKIPIIDDLYIDIGAVTQEQAEKYVSLGDSVVFISEFMNFGSDFIKSKALDDRAGCAIMVELINSELEYDCYFAFTVQEETGTTGVKTAAFDINPDISLILETTTAGDVGDTTGQKKVCSLGDGPVVSFMDSASIYDKKLYQLGFEVAKEKDIPCQTKTGIYGGNDARSAQIAGSGSRIMAISMPTRYIHSPSCVLKKSDILHSYDLISAVLPRLALV